MDDLKKINDKDKLNEYINKIVNIFRLSCPDKYIIFKMKIDNNNCNCNVSIYNEKGIDSKLDDISIECDSYFYDSFLNKLVVEVSKCCSIVKKDVVNLDGDVFVAFRMITENNDLFIIDGLEEERANSLINI